MMCDFGEVLISAHHSQVAIFEKLRKTTDSSVNGFWSSKTHHRSSITNECVLELEGPLRDGSAIMADLSSWMIQSVKLKKSRNYVLGTLEMVQQCLSF
jgi:hypothetical protein